MGGAHIVCDVNRSEDGERQKTHLAFLLRTWAVRQWWLPRLLGTRTSAGLSSIAVTAVSALWYRSAWSPEVMAAYCYLIHASRSANATQCCFYPVMHRQYMVKTLIFILLSGDAMCTRPPIHLCNLPLS